jgi:hypothetical protein
MARSRYSGSADDLAAVISRHVKSPTHFVYDESGGPADVKKLTKHAVFIRDLIVAQKNLSFTQIGMAAAVAQVQNSNGWTSSFKDDGEATHHATTVAKRIRAACRHVSQAMSKKTPPKWVFKLGFAEVQNDVEETEKAEEDGEEEEAEEDGEEDEEEEQEGEEDEDEEDVEAHDQEGEKVNVATTKTKAVPRPSSSSKDTWILWGWSDEFQMAWRATGPKPKDKRQYTKTLREPEGASPETAMTAIFDDGQTYELTDLLVMDWWSKNEALKQAAVAASSSELWSLTHTASGLKLSIRPRSDRKPLISLYLGPNQICQVPAEAFEKQQDAVDLLAATLQIGQGSKLSGVAAHFSGSNLWVVSFRGGGVPPHSCVRFRWRTLQNDFEHCPVFETVATNFNAGDISKDELFKCRDKLAAERGLSLKSKKVPTSAMKRPAAAAGIEPPAPAMKKPAAAKASASAAPPADSSAMSEDELSEESELQMGHPPLSMDEVAVALLWDLERG